MILIIFETVKFTRFIITIILCSHSLVYAQSTEEKEKLTAIYLNESLPDSQRVDAAISLADLTYFSDLDSTFKLIYQAKEWSLRSSYNYGLARVDGYLGYLYQAEGDFVNAIESFKKSIAFNLQHGFELERAMDLGNYGALLFVLNDSMCVDLFEESIAIYEKHEMNNDLVYLYANLGNVYLEQENSIKALENYRKSEKLATQGMPKMVAYNGMGTAFINMENPDSASVYARRMAKLAFEFGDSSTIGAYYYMMMMIKNQMNDLDSAIYYGDLGYSIKSNRSVQGKYYFNEHYSELLFQKGRYKEAYIALDSAHHFYINVHNNEMKNLAFREAVNFEYQEKHLADSLNFLREKELKEAEYQRELEVETQQRFILYIGLGFFVLIFGLAYRGYRRKRKDNLIISEQKELVENQKVLVEEINKEITDSIQYAKRIQTAILPSKKVIDQLIPDAFILYKPKAIVAGDFYWLEPTQEGVLFAAADCTGHGVPGAMVSVICNNALNRSVREYGLTDPGQILDKTRALVNAEFEKSDDEVKDGMDIALCHLIRKEYGGILKFSGANNPVWIVRKGDLIELKGDKQPVGKYEHANPFHQKEFELEKGDTIYVFSDGYVDQFGGEQLERVKAGGKKFKAKALKSLILSFQEESMQNQLAILSKTFEDWKGDLEQVDDVCIIGVRV